ncbi:MAG: class I SAM-dependent methyltransferase [Vulcanimicrobiota bacterium]
MDREERWDSYIRENLQREKDRFTTVNSFVEEFVRILKEEKKKLVLDLGCGIGRHALYLNQRGLEVIGYDISSETLEIAEQHALERKMKIDFVQGDYMDLPFGNGVFDAVLSIDTLHHDFLENIIRSFREVFRVLKPEGLFCVNLLSTSDHHFGKGRKLGERIFVSHRIPHYFFDLEELSYILERLNFELESVSIDRMIHATREEEIKREKFKIIARKKMVGKTHYVPIHNSIYW